MNSYCWFLRLTKPPCIGAAEEEGLVNMRLLLLPFTTTGLQPPLYLLLPGHIQSKTGLTQADPPLPTSAQDCII